MCYPVPPTPVRSVKTTEGVLEKGSLGSALGTSVVAFKGAGGVGCMPCTCSPGEKA